MLKKSIRLLILLVVFGLIASACSDDAAEETTTTAQEETTTTAGENPDLGPDPDKARAVTDIPEIGVGSPSPEICQDGQYKIGYNVFSDTDAVAASTIDSLNELADELGCVEVIVAVDGQDPAQVVTNIESFVQQGVDGVLSFNVVSAAGPPSYEILDDAGIRYVTIAIPAGETGSTFVVDDYTAGYQAGQALAEAYVEQFGSDSYPYVIIGRYDDAESGVLRLDGTEEAIREYLPGIPDDNVLAIETEADPSNASSRTLDVLSRVPEDAVVGVTGINDDTIFAMLQAIRQRGFSDDRIIAVTQGNGVPSGVEFVCENEPYVGGIDFFSRRYMEYALPALLAFLNGQDDLVPETLIGPTGFLTRDEVAEAHPDLCS